MGSSGVSTGIGWGVCSTGVAGHAAGLLPMEGSSKSMEGTKPWQSEPASGLLSSGVWQSPDPHLVFEINIESASIYREVIY